MGNSDPNAPYFEAEITSGLEYLAFNEISNIKGVRRPAIASPESIQFGYRHKKDWEELSKLRLVNAVHFVQPFAVPRPKSLLGHANWQIILDHIARVREQMPTQKYRSVYIQAAGKESDVLQRIQQNLAKDIKLKASDQGDLQVRIRRNKNRLWEVMVRLTLRPLATRPWRAVNMRGALNGPMAAAMVTLAEPQEGMASLNVMCGSASIMIESVQNTPQQAHGCDLSEISLQAAKENLSSAGLDRKTTLHQSDAQALPFSNNLFDIVYADLPWGQLVGTHNENTTLYPNTLKEIERVLKTDGRCVILTHEIKLLKKCVRMSRHLRIKRLLPLQRGNIQPAIFVLQKSA